MGPYAACETGHRGVHFPVYRYICVQQSADHVHNQRQEYRCQGIIVACLVNKLWEAQLHADHFDELHVAGSRVLQGCISRR